MCPRALFMSEIHHWPAYFSFFYLRLFVFPVDIWYMPLWVHKGQADWIKLEVFKIYVRNWIWHYHGYALSADIYLGLTIITVSQSHFRRKWKKIIEKQTISHFCFWIQMRGFRSIHNSPFSRRESSSSGHLANPKWSSCTARLSKWHCRCHTCLTGPGTKRQLHSFSTTLCPPETNPLTTAAPTLLAACFVTLLR